jgi:hypothetical protein
LFFAVRVLSSQNMAAYYEKRTVRKRRVKKGFMDESGRTFNIDKKKGAINVVEQEVSSHATFLLLVSCGPVLTDRFAINSSRRLRRR